MPKQSLEVFCKKRQLKILQTSLENTPVGVFFMKLQAFSLQVFFKKDSNTSASL